MKKILSAGTDPNPSAQELHNRALARRAAAEGFVLLENNGILPLKPQKLAVYGSGIRRTVKGGTGSGAVRERYSVTIEQGLKDAGYTLTTQNWLDRFDRFFDETYEAYRQEQEAKVAGIQNFYQMLGMITPFRHPTGIPVEDSDIENSDTDTALFVLSRQAGEGNDRADVPGDYQPDETEIANLKKLSAAYKNLIVVLNVGGLIDLSVLDDISVSALIYFVQGGEEGGNALADVLSGAKNFSGRLAVTWPLNYADVPSASTYSSFGKDRFAQEYNEGIYVGYRYYDTFNVPVRYRFGYGLSYTTFEKELTEIKASAEGVNAVVRVRNAGGAAGKETVLLYVSLPDTDEGTESCRLAAFAKTEELKPGEETVVKLDVSLKEMAVYEEASSCWAMPEGTYVFSVDGKPAGAVMLDAKTVLERCRRLCAAETPVCTMKAEPGSIVLPEGIPCDCLKAETITAVNNIYEQPEEPADDLVNSLSDEELAKLVCGGGTSNPNLQVAAYGASGASTPDLFETRGIPNIILSDGPAGLNLTSHIVELPDGSYKPANVPEVLEAYKRYFFGISKYGFLRQMAKPEEGVMHYQYTTAWPCSQLLAQTFDTALLEETGDAIGSEMETYGITVWLAPGMNIQRNPLCGRTFEYYSEDPLLSGKLAAAQVRGVQKHPGKGVSIKHFAANNCELERNSSSSNADERALREIYLRGFEIAVKEASPMTVMVAYNMINGTYCTNNEELLVNILRNEWGFKGMVMSDWDAMKADRTDCMKAVTGNILKAHRAQCDLVMPGRPDQVEALIKGTEQGIVQINDLRRSAVRILRIIRSNTVLESR